MAAIAPYVTGNFELVLDGVDVGIVNSLKGGNAKAEVQKISKSTEFLVKNQLGNVSFDDFQVASGLSMGQAYKDWIQSSLDSAFVYKAGEARSADFTRANVFSKEFKQALITEVAFPVCDASSKEVAYLSSKFKAEDVKMKKGDGAKVSKPFNQKQANYRQTDFKLVIDGLEATTSKCSKIESLVIKQTTTTDAIGDARIYEHIPGKLEMPNLKITFNEASIEPMMNWFDTFVIKGENEMGQEKTGSLQFLDATRGKVLLEISFTGLGIFSLTPADQSNNEGKVASAVAEMYCDEIKITSWDA